MNAFRYFHANWYLSTLTRSSKTAVYDNECILHYLGHFSHIYLGNWNKRHGSELVSQNNNNVVVPFFMFDGRRKMKVWRFYLAQIESNNWQLLKSNGEENQFFPVVMLSCRRCSAVLIRTSSGFGNMRQVGATESNFIKWPEFKKRDFVW